ncbi:MAG: hypothetical protein ACJA2M_001228 [Polaribacter sp.]|jgi:hypothetical protein
MKKLNLLFIVSTIFTVSLLAQQKTATNLKTSKSIYTFHVYDKDLNNDAALKKRLIFSSLELISTILPSSEFKINGSLFGPSRRSVFEFKYMKKKPTIYKLDDLARYQNNRLAREINYKNDPSQWNLHRIENRIQPYFLKKGKNKNSEIR